MGKSLAIESRKLFAQVSQERPATISCQAALIAIACMSAPYTPLELGHALLSKPKQIDRVIKAANGSAGHRKRNLIVSKDETVKIIREDYVLAQRMEVLTPDDLQWVVDDLYVRFQTGVIMIDENRRRAEVETLILRRGGKPYVPIF